MDKPLLVTVVGARPNFIKLAALSPEIRKVANEVIIHTGQHYDYKMSEIFFNEMHIPEPDIHLDIGSGPHGEQTGKMLTLIENALGNIHPDTVIVFGDTNSTLAGALAATKMHIPVIHIEAGLRSYDRTMPEEINRIIVDNISDLLFCPTLNSYNIASKIPGGSAFMEGDVMVDLLNSDDVTLNGDYYLLTIHREENDNVASLKNIFAGLSEITNDIVFPCHPRIRKNLSFIDIPKNVKIVDPVGYSEMQKLECGAKKIITDSGGIQKEAYLHKVPCITLRKSTEWIETLIGDWNLLTGVNSLSIQTALNIEPSQKLYYPNAFGKPGVCKRISEKIMRHVHG